MSPLFTGYRTLSHHQPVLIIEHGTTCLQCCENTVWKNMIRKFNSNSEMMKGGISHITHHSLHGPAGRRTISSLLPTASCPWQPMRSHYQFQLSYSSTKLSFRRIPPDFQLSFIQEHSFPLFSGLKVGYSCLSSSVISLLLPNTLDSAGWIAYHFLK